MQTRILNFIRRFYPSFGFSSSDIILASFPKSVNTWVSFLLAHVRVEYSDYDIDVNFLTIQDLTLSAETCFLKKTPIKEFPRVIKTHKEFIKRCTTRVIYIIRHPADVMTSYYHYLRFRWNKNLPEFSLFIRDEKYGIPAWIKHVKSWENNWSILVRYEDLKADTLLQLQYMVTLFDININEDVLERAVRMSSFQTMKKVMEKSGLPPKNGANPKYEFVRKGNIDKGKSMFTGNDYHYLNNIADELLEKYGYD